MGGRAKENLPEGSLKYLFVYFKIRIFKCSYRIYIYIYEFILIFGCIWSWPRVVMSLEWWFRFRVIIPKWPYDSRYFQEWITLIQPGHCWWVDSPLICWFSFSLLGFLWRLTIRNIVGYDREILVDRGSRGFCHLIRYVFKGSNDDRTLFKKGCRIAMCG